MFAVLISAFFYTFLPKNLICILVMLEILLLTVTLELLDLGASYDDLYGTMYAIVVLIMAGAESAIGLAITIAYYRLRGSISEVV
uniref:NADH-ubiquinone oxidoreductase chain 4L n=1 Tax=Candida buenavistaensis TaxID=434039 RepID=S5TF26_9ASCO|nr:NADH dehydrogenase subunit 4L [Candida buenavistaensis]AGS44072.1 NADH dehydrogenase subunit 4L [Candida buenavistaensis]